MAKEKTILINMRIPESLLAELDRRVEEDNLIISRTAKVISLIGADIRKGKRKKMTTE